MTEAKPEYLTIEPDPDYGPLPPFDGLEHTAFPGERRAVIVARFVAGATVAELASEHECAVVDVEHVLRVALGYVG